MAQIGTLVTGAGITTTIGPNADGEQFIVLGDVDTAMPLSGISVDVGGENTINIVGSQPLVSAFAKYMSQFTATLVGLVLKIATGKLMKKTTYRFTNNGVTTPAIFGFSEGSNGPGKPLRALSQGINALSNQVFTKFTALLITPSANLGNLDFVYRDGTSVTMTALEADALFAMKNPTEANGRLDAVVTTIDNREGLIASVRVNATTAVTVVVVNFADEDFQELKASI